MVNTVNHVHVSAFLADKLAEAATAVAAVEKGLELSVQRVLEETMRIAYSNLSEAFDENGQLKAPKD